MKREIMAAALLLATIFGGIEAKGADFFDTSRPRSLFTFGVRLGVNTANRTINKDIFNTYSNNSWGTGLEAGATVDINFRDFISIQPGFFYECLNGNFTYANRPNPDSAFQDIQYGHWRRYVGTIPVMASVHFNFSDDIRWNLEAGPYLQFSFGHSEDSVYIPFEETSFKATPNGGDFGIKMGTGLTFFSKYSFNIHYMAGCRNAWQNGLGGKKKAWTFTIGYTL